MNLSVTIMVDCFPKTLLYIDTAMKNRRSSDV